MSDSDEMKEILRAIENTNLRLPKIMRTLAFSENPDIDAEETILFVRDIALVIGFAEAVYSLGLFRKAALFEALYPVMLQDLKTMAHTEKIGIGPPEDREARIRAYEEIVAEHGTET